MVATSGLYRVCSFSSSVCTLNTSASSERVSRSTAAETKEFADISRVSRCPEPVRLNFEGCWVHFLFKSLDFVVVERQLTSQCGDARTGQPYRLAVSKRRESMCASCYEWLWGNVLAGCLEFCQRHSLLIGFGLFVARNGSTLFCLIVQ